MAVTRKRLFIGAVAGVAVICVVAAVLSWWAVVAGALATLQVLTVVLVLLRTGGSAPKKPATTPISRDMAVADLRAEVVQLRADLALIQGLPPHERTVQTIPDAPRADS